MVTVIAVCVCVQNGKDGGGGGGGESDDVSPSKGKCTGEGCHVEIPLVTAPSGEAFGIQTLEPEGLGVERHTVGGLAPATEGIPDVMCCDKAGITAHVPQTAIPGDGLGLETIISIGCDGGNSCVVEEKGMGEFWW